MYTYNYGNIPTETLFGAGIIVLVAIVLVAICGILGNIFLGLSIYNDAKARGNDNPGMWGVLAGIFTWIPAIIYLCVRNNAKNRLIACATCGFFMTAATPGCPNCGQKNPHAVCFDVPEMSIYRKKAKKFLIAFICLYGVSILLMIAMWIMLLVWFGNTALYTYR